MTRPPLKLRLKLLPPRWKPRASKAGGVRGGGGENGGVPAIRPMKRKGLSDPTCVPRSQTIFTKMTMRTRPARKDKPRVRLSAKVEAKSNAGLAAEDAAADAAGAPAEAASGLLAKQ
jgi:hypothetical protein